MRRFIFSRLSEIIILCLLLSFICFSLLTFMPGDPVDIMISSNPKITSEDIKRLKKLYGLDNPLHVRYFNWFKNVIKGELGYSRTYKIPVEELIFPRLFNTFLLASLSLFFALIFAIPLGILAALFNKRIIDYLINFFAFIGISMPSFWLAIILIMIFAVKFPVWFPSLGFKFPAGGTMSISQSFEGFSYILDRLKYLILPSFSLAFIQMGRYIRFIRSSMIENLNEDYIITAKAKGLSNFNIVIKHAFRNALIPLITILAISISSIFSGALLTESVFAYQGIGKLIYESIMANDFNVAMIAFLISIISVLIMNFIADITYHFMDPRIKY